MLAGRRPFDGKTQASVIGAILHAEPALVSSLLPMAPPVVDRVVRKCLAKDPDARWQTARDLGDQLQWLLDESVARADAGRSESEPAAPYVGARNPKRRRLDVIAWCAGLLLAAASSAAVWSLTRTSPPVPRPTMRFGMSLMPELTLDTASQPGLTLSPDGSHLAFVARLNAGAPQIYVRAMNQLEATPIRGTDGGTHPFFSRDGQWIGFQSADGKLKKAPLRGGTAITICDAPAMRGAVWLADDTIVLNPRNRDKLVRVPAAGGVPTPLTTGDQNFAILHRWVDALPDGRTILFAEQRETEWSGATIYAQRVDGGQPQKVIEGGTYPRYLAGGYLLFARGSAVFVVSFDPRALRVSGVPVPVLDGIAADASAGLVQLVVSPSGLVAYIPRISPPGRSLVWVDGSGTVQPLSVSEQNFEYPRMAPDGQRVALQLRNNVWVYQLGGGNLSRLTFEKTEAEAPAWTPDGNGLTYTTDTGSNPGRNVKSKPADGSAGEQLLWAFNEHLHPAGWTPRGDVLIAAATQGEGRGDIWLLSRGKPPEPFMRTAHEERGPALSTDGRWLAYSSNETGRFEIYVQAFPGPGGKWQISTTGGSEPAWARSGRQLFYRDGEKLLAVSVDVRGATLSAGTPRLLFQGRFALSPVGDRWYDVDQDGQRFLMLKVDDTQNNPRIVAVQDWTSELTRLVTEKKQ